MGDCIIALSTAYGRLYAMVRIVFAISAQLLMTFKAKSIVSRYVAQANLPFVMHRWPHFIAIAG